MARIPPEQLPQPIYPQPTGQPTPGAPPVPPPDGGPAKRPPVALIAGIAGTVVVVIAIVVVLVITLGSEKKPSPTPTAAPPSGPVGSGSGGASNARAAANLMLGEVSMPPGESQCVVDAFDHDAALADAVVAGTADPTDAANLLAGCVSGNTVADAVTRGLAGQYPPDSIACYHSNIASMDAGSLSQLLASVIAGDVQSAQTILSYAATGC